MKNIVILLVTLVVGGLIGSFWAGNNNNNSGINFYKGTFEEAVAEANKQGKPLFVDVYTSWCGPCKRMAKNVFTIPRVGEFYNKNFVCYKLNAEDRNDLREKYAFTSFPTLMFLMDGEPYYRIPGSLPPDEFIALGEKALAGENNCAPIQQWEKGERNNELAYKAAKYFFEQNRKDDAYDVLEYIMNKKIVSKEIFELALDYSSIIFEPHARYILNNREAFVRELGEEVDDYLLSLTYDDILEHQEAIARTNFLLGKLKSVDVDYSNCIIQLESLNELLFKGKYTLWMKKFTALMKENKYPFFQEKALKTTLMSRYFCEFKASDEEYKQLIKIADSLLEKNKTGEFLLIKACCYRNMGDKKKWEELREKAVMLPNSKAGFYMMNI